MAQHEVLILNESVPQIQAPQTGDTYYFPRTIEQTADLTIKLGDNAGANKLSILDSDDAEVAYIDSDGQARFEKTIFLNAAETVKIAQNTSYISLTSTSGTMRFGSTQSNGFGLTPDHMRFGRGNTTSQITQEPKSNDAAPTGAILIKGQDAYASAVTNQDGGNVNIKLGDSASGGGEVGKFQVLAPDDSVEVSFGESGVITFNNLPTADPTSAGQLWNDSGTLKVSAG